MTSSMLQAAKLALLEEVKTALEGVTNVYDELSQKDAQGMTSFMRFAYTTTYFDFFRNLISPAFRLRINRMSDP